MKKLWIGLVVAMAALIMCGCAMADTSGTCGDNLTWTLTDDGVLTISGTGRMYSYDITSSGDTYITTAPWKAAPKQAVIEEGVTSISGFAFYGCSSLTSISIPDSVIQI